MAWQLADAIPQNRLVQGNDLRNVRDGIFW